MRRLITVLVVAAVTLCGSLQVIARVPATALAAAASASSVDAALTQTVTRGDVPGVVAMAVTRSGVVYRGAFGVADAAARRPLTTDAIFRIASMTKPVTSAAAMQLVEQHRLSLDDPAQKYFPEFSNLKVFERFDAASGDYTLRPATKKLTVRHLLTNTS